ncbi:helix-turn-helix domain-containing protein [Streptomyces sp. CB02009]|uniref:helix-turn-helix domain-containing protein n=1 Tax=Streptomyces sp. CB02009 TaxID=1703938 RepID=UPI0009400142|nr:helix-turn-helix transcriptional regulator [Streptomyces sp. CB02009]
MSAGVRLAGRIIEGRLEMGQSQRGLAEICNMDFSTISRIESAERVPSALHLCKLLNAFVSGGLTLDTETWTTIVREATGCTVVFRPDGHVGVQAHAGLPEGPITPDAAKWLMNNKAALRAYSSYAVSGLPNPRNVRTRRDLCEAMEQMWRRSGYRSAREMEHALDKYARRFRKDSDKWVPNLGRTTLNTMLRGVQREDDPVFPKKLDNFKAFMIACGHHHILEPWVAAWHRAAKAPTEADRSAEVATTSS